MAKFKVGDKVKVKGAGVETILAVYPKGRGAVGMRLDPSVDWYGSSEGGFITDEDIDGIANSARNAKPTRGFKFKVGDKAMLVWSQPGAGEIVKLTGKTPAGLFKFKMDDGGEGQVEEKDLAPASMHISANSAPVTSTNVVVQNALNARAVCNGYVVLRTASGGTARVYEGDRVSYAGKEYVAKALGSPQMDKATLVDGSGNKLIVRLKDVDLKALNARRARNAGDLSAPFQAALSAVRKLAEEAKKINPDHEVYKDAVKAGTALLRVKPKW